MSSVTFRLGHLALLRTALLTQVRPSVYISYLQLWTHSDILSPLPPLFFAHVVEKLEADTEFVVTTGGRGAGLGGGPHCDAVMSSFFFNRTSQATSGAHRANCAESVAPPFFCLSVSVASPTAHTHTRSCAVQYTAPGSRKGVAWVTLDPSI